MRKLLFLLACFFLASIGMLNAQSTIASGRVVASESGEAVIGASVMVKGTALSTVTDVNGRFTINLSGNSRTLVVKFIGLKTVEVQATTNMTIQMESSSLSLIHISEPTR